MKCKEMLLQLEAAYKALAVLVLCFKFMNILKTPVEQSSLSDLISVPQVDTSLALGTSRAHPPHLPALGSRGSELRVRRSLLGPEAPGR